MYIDNIIVTSAQDQTSNKFIHKLAAQFSLKDLGDLFYFLGVEVQQHPIGLFLTQKAVYP